MLRAIAGLEGGGQPVARENAVPGGLERRPVTVERACSLAAAGRGVRDAGLLARLESIAQQARDAHAYAWVPELELAAAGLRADLNSLSRGASRPG